MRITLAVSAPSTNGVNHPVILKRKTDPGQFARIRVGIRVRPWSIPFSLKSDLSPGVPRGSLLIVSDRWTKPGYTPILAEIKTR